jgi:hypothetical protein
MIIGFNYFNCGMYIFIHNLYRNNAWLVMIECKVIHNSPTIVIIIEPQKQNPMDTLDILYGSYSIRKFLMFLDLCDANCYTCGTSDSGCISCMETSGLIQHADER